MKPQDEQTRTQEEKIKELEEDLKFYNPEMIRIRIRLRKDKSTFVTISDYTLFGLVRGLSQAGRCQLTNSIELIADENYFIVDAHIRKDRFKMVKGQAESYGVSVEQID